MLTKWRNGLQWCALLVLLLSGLPLAAQSGPYGNEWIVAGQPYYKIKVVRDGIYHLDYQYLTKAGISGVNPQDFQLFRRGKEVALYVGGNNSSLDQTTYLEFYGQRNDGQLDRGMYLKAKDQPHQLYSLFTDTAAYFLTWKTGAAGKRMAESNQAGTNPHAYWWQSRRMLITNQYQAGDNELLAFASWAEEGEAYISGDFNSKYTKEVVPLDSIRNIVRSGPNPLVSVALVGASNYAHTTDISVVPPLPGTTRLLGSLLYSGFSTKNAAFSILTSDVDTKGKLNILFAIHSSATDPNDRFRIAYFKVKYPQLPRWATTRSITFQNDSTLTGSAYYTLDSIPATTHGYDITNPYAVERIEGQDISGSKRGFVFPAANGQTRSLLVADAAKALVPAPARKIDFRSIDPAKVGFLIISNSVLMQSVDGVSNPVRAYAEYRASAAGGKYDTLVVTSQQLYDQFHYGETSPLAIRHIAQWLIAGAPNTSRYMLLLGRGLLPGEKGPNTGLYRQGEANYPEKNLVPTSTRGASDIFFSADWETGSYLAKIPTGRIAARTPTDVLSYLNKLKEHEALGNEPWRKNVLHMAGGEDKAQQAQFQAYMNKYKKRVEAPLFGGRVVRTITRTLEGDYNRFPVYVNIASELNAGLTLITYFGHGAPTTFDLNLGNPNDPVNNYTNKGKYPVFIINGCAAGNAFTASPTSVGEIWTLAPNRGAIGYLADSDFGYEHQLDYYCDNLYKALFNDPAWYGKPIPVVFREVARQVLEQFPSDPHAISLAMNTTWQGDPTLSLYAPDKPDYATDDTRLEVAPAAGQTKVQATSPTFLLKIGASNLGKLTRDSLHISITREYPSANGRANEVITRAFPPLSRDSILTVEIANTGNVFGQNRFTVQLDAPGKVDELNESNNQASITYNFLQGGVTLLSPIEFAIVPSNAVHLVAQNNDPLAAPRAFEFELDTVPTFDSPAVLRTSVTASVSPDWRPTLTGAAKDSIVYYWRLRFKDPQADEIQDWAVSSFRVIEKSPQGWSQSHYGQFARNEAQGLSVSSPASEWKFEELKKSITLRTGGGGSATGNGITFKSLFGIQVEDEATYNANCGTNQANILIAVFNPTTLERVTDIAGGPYLQCGQAPDLYYHFGDVNTAARRTQLTTFLNNIPQGYYVAAVSLNRVKFSTFPATLKAAFTSVGSALIDNLQDSDPFVILGQKGLAAGKAQEMTADPNSTTPRYDQVITLTAPVKTQGTNGILTSTRIGPAQEWGTLFHEIRSGASGQYILKVIGIDAEGASKVLYETVQGKQFSLSEVSAKDYPYLQLELQLQNVQSRQAPQLKQWLVTYQGFPEGLVRRDLATAGSYDNATLEKQAESGTITVPVVFQNVSTIDFSDKVKAVATVRNGNTVSPEVTLTAPRILRADSTVTYLFKLDVAGLTGATSVHVDVNPKLLPELYYFNNQLDLSFNAPDKNLPPTLDVAFDGQHILNGDIVSPSPVITAVLHDEDKVRVVKDPNNFQLLLTRPGGTVAERIDMNSPAVTFRADAAKGTAQVEYRPEKLADGVYKLQVQGTDVNGTNAAAERYEVSFEVINASTITNIYPYPNPVTNKTRFVFTMTGAELPRDMKIQIMTLTGKVVREIMMAELGPLHIGNNISQFAWDGTDEFGDRLANGTYLYRVIMDQPGQFERRRTAGDKAFKKDWGKLVLLR